MRGIRTAHTGRWDAPVWSPRHSASAATDRRSDPRARRGPEKALGGVNLIDTSTNYADGSSETCIGNVLARQQREELIVVSKVGYVQGQALAMARTREQRGSAFPEMVKYTEGCWHCIHPEFLADQLGRSLGRLRVEKVDVYLLHNPEYFFTEATKRHKRRLSMANC